MAIRNTRDLRAWRLACWLLACLPWLPMTLAAESLPVASAVFEAVGDDVSEEPLLAGALDDLYVPVDAADVHLPGGFDRSHWIRLRIELPPPGDDSQDWVLQFGRLPLQRISVWLPLADGRWRREDDGFYAPAADIDVLSGSYAFRLPERLAGPVTVYAQVQERHGVTLRPQVLSGRSFHVEDRRAGGIAAATYSAIVVLLLSSFALFLALRERSHLHFVGMTASWLLMLLALNGGLYALPGLAWFGAWHDHGIYALALACGALSLGFTRHVIHASVPQRLDRIADRIRYVYAALAIVALCNIASLGPLMQKAVALACLSAAALAIALTWRAWRAGDGLARSFCLLWVVLGVLVLVRVAVAFAWLPPDPRLLGGFQLTIALCMLLLSIGLADQVMEVRKQREIVHEQKQQVDADLQLEQARREFADDLRERLRLAPPGGELEWVAFRRLLSHLKTVLPQRSAAVVAYGYHGLDLLLTDPLDGKPRYTRLVLERGGTLKGLCRSRSPMQVSLDELGKEGGAAQGSQFAVVPMVVSRPGWGALLIERGPGEAFAPDELKRAAEFLRVAVTATDEAVHQAELKNKAEIDQLTGVYNRRAGDALLAAAMARAIADRRPLSLLFVDLDHFKMINDRHGHPVGDECLRLASAVISRQLGENDLLVRYGGEEFLVVLPGHQPDQAREVGERIRHAVAQIRVDSEAGPVRFTVSIGVAARQANEDTPAPVIERADRALYGAKRNGRNQVHVASFAYGAGAYGSDREDSLTL